MDRRLFRILVILSLLSVVGGLLLYPSLPDTVPTHWNIQGNADSYGPKYVALILLVIPLLATVGLWFLPALDPRGKNHRKSPRALNFISAATVLVLIALGWITLLPGLGLRLPVSKFIMGAIGVMLVVTGNFMPQVRSNFFIGIRTPWALSNETVWRRTHRLGGVVFCMAGVLMILGVFLPAGLLQSLPLAFLLAGTAGVYVYSYVLYRRLIRNKNHEK